MHGLHSTHTLPGSTVTIATSERQEDALDRIADQLEEIVLCFKIIVIGGFVFVAAGSLLLHFLFHR